MRIGWIIIFVCSLIYSHAQKAAGKYIKDKYTGITTLKIKFYHRYKSKFIFYDDVWEAKKKPMKGIRCIPPGYKKPKRKKIMKGTWETNGDTLFLILKRSRGFRPEPAPGWTQKWLISKNGLKNFKTDSLIYRRKLR